MKADMALGSLVLFTRISFPTAVFYVSVHVSPLESVYVLEHLTFVPS